MEKINFSRFFGKHHNNNKSPFNSHFDLTYRCNFNCIHCYCKGSENENKELNTKDWKRIINKVQKEGCIHLCLSGGEPLKRRDFLELYAYAKQKAFLVSILTNASLFTKKLVNYLAKFPPYRIEVTLNGITEKTYESITQAPGSFTRVLQNIKLLAKAKLPLVLKADLLRQNKHEVVNLKKFSEKLIGKPRGNKDSVLYNFTINSRLNGDLTPTRFRLPAKELAQIKTQRRVVGEPCQYSLNTNAQRYKKRRPSLYQCSPLRNEFLINPYGRLKFCMFSEQYSCDLKNNTFKDALNLIRRQVSSKKYGVSSKCAECSLMPICSSCPARAYLEIGKEDSPVLYYCQLAKATKEAIHVKSCHKID